MIHLPPFGNQTKRNAGNQNDLRERERERERKERIKILLGLICFKILHLKKNFPTGKTKHIHEKWQRS